MPPGGDLSSQQGYGWIAQPQGLFERIEVAVAVQGRVTVDDAEGRDQAADDLADRLPACSQPSIVAGSSDGKVDAPGLEDFEPPKVTQYSRCLRVRRNALQHFAEDEVRQAEALLCEFAIEPIGLGIDVPFR